MRFDVNTAKSAAMIVIGTLGLSFAPHAQACGELHGQAGAAALALFASQLEAHSASSVFAAQLTPHSPVSEANTNAEHRQPSLVGMWTVGFYHQGDQLWDVGIEQFYADGNEMTNDNAYPPAQGNICWGVWERVANGQYKIKHIGWVFDAISPGAQWMVGGEWGTMSHLQIYPTPYLNHRTSPQGGALPLTGYIRLDHPVNNVQGCTFTSKTTLICASDDGSQKLFSNQKPLLEVVLPHAANGATMTGHVVDLGSIPQRSACPGFFEAEGVDYAAASATLRVEIIQPGSCILHTTVYEYTRAG